MNCADNDGQRVAEQRSRCEHVDLLEREIGHVTAPLGLLVASGKKHKEPLLANRFALNPAPAGQFPEAAHHVIPGIARHGRYRRVTGPRPPS